MAQMLKNLPAMQETQVQLLEKGMATHSILAWRIPWTDKPSRLQSIGSQRVGQDQATDTSLHFKKGVFAKWVFWVPCQGTWLGVGKTESRDSNPIRMSWLQWLAVSSVSLSLSLSLCLSLPHSLVAFTHVFCLHTCSYEQLPTFSFYKIRLFKTVTSVNFQNPSQGRILMLSTCVRRTTLNQSNMTK